MSKLTWGDSSFESGVDRGVFYPKNGVGYAWSGLVSVNETTEDASQSLIYVDGMGHHNQMLLGSFSAAIEAITYPEEFEPFDGYTKIYAGQRRKTFDFSYRTLQEDDHYKIHLVYNALVTPTNRNNSSINSSVEVQLFSWDLTTSPEVVPDARGTSHFVIDTKYVNANVVADIESHLYGTDDSQADMPPVSELLAIFEEHAIFRVTDNGDGTATITGPDDAVYMSGLDTAIFDYETVEQVSDDTYSLTSL